jgi:hypothetical protein
MKANYSHVKLPGLTRKQYAELRRLVNLPFPVSADDYNAMRTLLLKQIKGMETWWYKNGERSS